MAEYIKKEDIEQKIQDGINNLIDSAEGIVALLYTAAWAYAELREKLMRYEDTGLEPEDLKSTVNIDYVRIMELLKADKDGRLVVLPCGTGVELVRDGHAFKADHWNHTLTAFLDAPENKSGKQVALFSIEEAEAALSGKDIAALDTPDEPAEPEWKSKVMRTFLGGR